MNIPPLLLNTLGGLVAILLIVILIKEMSRYNKSIKEAVGEPPYKNGHATALFENSVPFRVHATEQSRIATILEKNCVALQEMSGKYDRLIFIGERQLELLEKMVLVFDRRKVSRE